MFGGYGIFESDDMFALMSGKALFFKVGEANRVTFESVDSQRYGSMPYFKVPDDVLADSRQLEQWARAAIAVGHATAKNKRRVNRG